MGRPSLLVKTVSASAFFLDCAGKSCASAGEQFVCQCSQLSNTKVGGRHYETKCVMVATFIVENCAAFEVA